MTRIDQIADALSADHQSLVIAEGEVIGMPYSAHLMRPLVRRGLFDRVERKGFQTRWQLTEVGREVRAHLLDRVHNISMEG